MKRWFNFVKQWVKNGKRGETSQGDMPHQGTPVYFSPQAQQGHTLVLGQIQTEKTALTVHLAKAAMREDTALVVLDVDGDLIPSLCAQIPQERLKDVIWLDFENPTQTPGLNVLEMPMDLTLNEVVSNLVHTTECVWHADWSSRAGQGLRQAVRTLWSSNQTLAQRNEPQFTLLDVPSLFNLPTFRRRLLNTLVTDHAVKRWWLYRYEAMPPVRQFDSIDNLLPLLNRLAVSGQVKNILGQSSSTFFCSEFLRPGSISLIQLSHRSGNLDFNDWLGALILDRTNQLIFARRRMRKGQILTPVTVVVHGAQPIPRIDSPGYLAELQRLGARYIITRETLENSDTANELAHEILSGMRNLFVFQTEGYDAEAICEELDDIALMPRMMQLPDRECLFANRQDNGEFLMNSIKTLPPLGDIILDGNELIKLKMERTRPVEQIKLARKAFTQEWYCREMAFIREQMARKIDRSDESPEQTETP